MKLTQQQKDNIKQAIEKVEQKTAGEVVTVMAAKSDSYRFVSLFWAVLFAFTISGFLVMYSNIALPYVFWAQLFSGLVFWLVFSQTNLGYRLVPKSIAHRRAHQKACEQFVTRGVHLTENHTGILLFVSVAEHYVEVLADQGISDVISQDKWDKIVADFIASMQAKEFEQGFIEAIYACGDILEVSVPKPENNKNELADGLIEIA